MIEKFPFLFPSTDFEPIDFKQIPYLLVGEEVSGSCCAAGAAGRQEWAKPGVGAERSALAVEMH